MNDYILLPDDADPADIWFTADHHFGHHNIIGFTNRPFDDIDHMDNALIDAWNTRIQPSDWVFHLGDFCLGEYAQAQKYFRQLNGQIHILGLPWHHDRRWLSHYHFGAYWPVVVLPSQVVMQVPFEVNGRYTIVHLNHYPMLSWDRSHYGAWHLYGHVHAHQNTGPEYKCNVGVDVWNFDPINLLMIKNFMEKKGWPISPLERGSVV